MNQTPECVLLKAIPLIFSEHLQSDLNQALKLEVLMFR